MILFLLLALAAPVEGEKILRSFHFNSGETQDLRIHYRTFGAPGLPAVLVLHGTTGSGAQFTGPGFAGALFDEGQPLDARTHYLVLPDGIGHGKSSKPSDGQHAHFPHYDYDDMVHAQHELLLQLGVKHLQLVIGTSMGGMHAWVWGEKYPQFMDALMPLASAPVQIAGRNRVMRDMVMDSIRGDAAYAGGDYKQQPAGLRAALDVILLMGSAPMRWQADFPSRDQADAFYEGWMKKRLPEYDANDVLYAFDASRTYDPAPLLEKIAAPLTAVNSGDDAINPPRAGHRRARDQARSLRRVRAGPRLGEDLWPRHAHPPGVLEARAGEAAPARGGEVVPAVSDGLVLQGRALLEARKPVEAEALFEQALAAAPPPERARVAVAAGRAAQRAGEPRMAARWYRRAGELSPRDPEPPHDRGIALLEAGEVGLAAQAQAEALALDPEHAGARAQRAAALEALGDDAGAARELAALLSRLGPQPALSIRLIGLQDAARRAGQRRLVGNPVARLDANPLVGHALLRALGEPLLYRAPFAALRGTAEAGLLRRLELIFDDMDASLARSDLAYGGSTEDEHGRRVPLDEFTSAAVVFLSESLGIDPTRARRLLQWLLTPGCGVGPHPFAGARVGWVIEGLNGARRYGLFVELPPA